MDSAIVERLQERTGLRIAGVLVLGDSPEIADESIEFVRCGKKRATVGQVPRAGREAGRPPAPGQHWGILDGDGEPRCVVQTVEVRRGLLGEATPSFAWDEGEDDRSLESWLDGHRRRYRRRGATSPDGLEVVFERFRVVWPDAELTEWLTGSVRELRWDERAWYVEAYRDRWGDTWALSRGWLRDVSCLPVLVCQHRQDRVGALAFRPRPDGVTECVSVDTFVRPVPQDPDEIVWPDEDLCAEIAEELLDGLAELARRQGWRKVLPALP